MEPITVTRDQIIYDRRVRVLAHAEKTGNVSETCRTFGISRKTFYEWHRVAERYGLEALMPKARRRPQLPNATPTHVVAELLAVAVAEPTRSLTAWPTGATWWARTRCRSTSSKPGWAAGPNAWLEPLQWRPSPSA